MTSSTRMIRRFRHCSRRQKGQSLLLVLIWLAVMAGVWTMAKLRRRYALTVNAALRNAVPPVQSTGGALVLGHFAPVFLPALFIVIWTLLMVRS